MLRESLSHATPAALTDGALHLAVNGALHLEGLDRSKSVVADAVSEVTGHKVRVVLEVSAAAPRAPEPEAARLDPTSDKEQRLRLYRSKDQALDTAADLLDLELTE